MTVLPCMNTEMGVYTPPKQRRHPYRAARSFCLVIVLISALAVYSASPLRPNTQHGVSHSVQRRNSAFTLAEDLECHLVHNAEDKCAFVRKNCPDEQAGLFSYLEFYFCSSPRIQPLAFTVIVLWLGLLFSTIGIAASDFFCINLSTIANLLGMSESLTGVTFLAFGNGSPDVFSTFSAMSTNSGSLAIGELIGAAGFITTVVAGSMAFVHPFKVAKKSFVRDVSFFIIAATFSMIFLYDGMLYPWEAAFMVGIYVFYVIFVVTWHWWFSRRRRRREIEVAARAQYVGPGSDAAEFPAYHDDEAPGAPSPRPARSEDFSALEQGGITEDDDDEERKEQREELMLGEISRNMRLSRPRLNSRRITHNPVRPSLIGVLEFRSVVAGLHRSGNTQSIPLNLRRYSDDPRVFVVQPDDASAFSEPRSRAPYDLNDEERTLVNTIDSLDVSAPPSNRARAISAPEADSVRLNTDTNQLDLLGPLGEDQTTTQVSTRSQDQGLSAPCRASSASLSPSVSVHSPKPSSIAAPQEGALSPALLAPPDHFATRATQGDHSNHLSPSAQSGKGLKLRIPQASSISSHGTNGGDGSLHLASPSLSPDSRIRGDVFSLDEATPKPLRWWPYKILPPPGELGSTLFPTLTRWREKSYWEKFLGIIAAPSVFLLTITLPVVETDGAEDEKDDDIPDLTLPGYNSLDVTSNRSRVTIIEPNRSPSLDEGHHARETRSLPHAYAKGLGGHGTAATIAASTESIHQIRDHAPPHPHNRTYSQQNYGSILSPGDTGGMGAMMVSPEQLPVDAVATNDEIRHDWNRWLVILQIFTAPFFIVLIVWAKMDLGEPLKLIRPTMISMVCSLVALAIILATTTASRAPKWRALLCFLGFCVSIAWISTVADEVVGVLKTVGVVLNMSDAILGLTIFAVGNSLGDLVADVTVAKLGYPVMALSACFGGPMLNILLGVGLSGLYLTIKGAHEKQDKHPGRKLKYKPYHIDVSRTLMISGATLLVTLVGLLITVPLRRWKMDRVIGWGLIALWATSTIGNVTVEVLGLGVTA